MNKKPKKKTKNSEVLTRHITRYKTICSYNSIGYKNHRTRILIFYRTNNKPLEMFYRKTIRIIIIRNRYAILNVSEIPKKKRQNKHRRIPYAIFKYENNVPVTDNRSTNGKTNISSRVLR